MKKLSNNELRNIWFDFWKEKGHDVVLSAPLIPINDPTLLWVNAGVTPLKKYFDGSVVPENRRMTNIQKCIRTNDIDNVGQTARHATFFEMMGNFSIGDYFKEEALTWAWEFLTEKLEFEKELLYVTIYPDDEITYEIWKSLGLEDEHIIRLEGNFWEIGAGPSGPDSEIFYDRGEMYDPEKKGLTLLKEDLENDRYVEIWNNVFSMYNANPEVPRSEYEELPSKNIDTGMGLERMLMVLQDKNSIFETDVFMPIINKLEELTGLKYDEQPSFRVIADHIRSITFAIADGASFGNNGRDYVLRRLLRRAVRYGRKIGLHEPFMTLLVPVVIEMMGESYSYLESRKEVIIDKVHREEELFYKTLVQGEKRFNEIIDNSIDKKISGEEAFKLYDTYGFPFELTSEMAKDLGYEISEEEFHLHMKQQQEMARNSREKVNSMNLQNEELLKFNKESEFIGYNESKTNSKIIALFDGNKFVESLKAGYIVLDKTPFYAEAGGQVSDSGYFIIENKQLEVIGMFKGPNKQHFHYIESDFEIKVDTNVEAVIDEEKRSAIVKNHSAAHLLQKSLKEVLGESVSQAGSRIDEHTLRYDFMWEGKVNSEDLIKVEELVNDKIKTSLDTTVDIMDLDDAITAGATALFEDKYEKRVRVIEIADSKELCGGTHVKNVGEIIKFAIKSFESKGNNLYRIEAATADNIERELFDAIKPYNDNMIKLLTKARKIINNALLNGIELPFDININNDAPTSYKDIIFNINEMETIKMKVQELEKLYLDALVSKAIANISEFEDKIESNENFNSLIMTVENNDIEVLKAVIKELGNRHSKLFIFVANISENNVNYISKSDVEGLNAGSLVKEASLKSKGNGGGSPKYAQGGGTDTTELNKIIDEVKNIVKNFK